MGLEIYNKVVEIIGELPSNYHFVYAIGTIIIFIVILWAIIYPFKLIYESCVD